MPDSAIDLAQDYAVSFAISPLISGEGKDYFEIKNPTITKNDKKSEAAFSILATALDRVDANYEIKPDLEKHSARISIDGDKFPFQKVKHQIRKIQTELSSWEKDDEGNYRNIEAFTGENPLNPQMFSAATGDQISFLVKVGDDIKSLPELTQLIDTHNNKMQELRTKSDTPPINDADKKELDLLLSSMKPVGLLMTEEQVKEAANLIGFTSPVGRGRF